MHDQNLGDQEILKRSKLQGLCVFLTVCRPTLFPAHGRSMTPCTSCVASESTMMKQGEGEMREEARGAMTLGLRARVNFRVKGYSLDGVYSLLLVTVISSIFQQGSTNDQQTGSTAKQQWRGAPADELLTVHLKTKAAWS